jgi:hypothetical protein
LPAGSATKLLYVAISDGEQRADIVPFFEHPGSPGFNFRDALRRIERKQDVLTAETTEAYILAGS